jgi:hypothetical protein
MFPMPTSLNPQLSSSSMAATGPQTMGNATSGSGLKLNTRTMLIGGGIIAGLWLLNSLTNKKRRRKR